jgi:integrase
MNARNKFSDLGEPQLSDFEPLSIAWAVQIHIEEMNGWSGRKPVKQGGLGQSHCYTLRNLQRWQIGKRDATKLTEDDIIEHCKWRLDQGVMPSTINQDVGYLSGALKYVRAARRDCKGIQHNVIKDVRPFLVANGYIAKSIPRKRVPTDEEIHQLLALAGQPQKTKHKNTIYAMPDIIACGLVSSRRIGEIMGVRRSCIDWDHKDKDGLPAPTYTVEKMKHPTKKDHTKTFPLFPELAEIFKRQPIKPGDEDRVFPFLAKSVGAKYTRFKNQLGIKNLRFHDNRRAAITYWLTKMTPHQVRHFISGHESVKMIESNYDATDPALGHAIFRKLAAGESPAPR